MREGGLSQSGNDDPFDLPRHVLSPSRLCHAGQVVYLGVRTR
jgi:hypothetical protein